MVKNCPLEKSCCFGLCHSLLLDQGQDQQPYSWGTSLAPSASQTKHTVQQGRVCWHCVLDCGLGPRLVARTVKRNRQPGLTVLKQRAELQQQQCKQNSPCNAVYYSCNDLNILHHIHPTSPSIHCTMQYTWSDNIIQKPLTVYSGGIRTSQ